MPETNLKRLRQAAGLTQKELAEKSGVNFRSLQDYEQRKKDINGIRLEAGLRIAKALNTDAKNLLE